MAAGELKSSIILNTISTSGRYGDVSSFRSSPPTRTFKAAGLLATVATTGSGVTPRKYIKLLHHCITILEKHRQELPAEALKAMKVFCCSCTAAVPHGGHCAAVLQAAAHRRLRRQLRQLRLTAKLLFFTGSGCCCERGSTHAQRNSNWQAALLLAGRCVWQQRCQRR